MTKTPEQEQERERSAYATARPEQTLKPLAPKPMNTFTSATRNVQKAPEQEQEPEQQEQEAAPEPINYQADLPDFAGLRVPQHEHFKNKHRQRGAYIEHELDAILRQQQEIQGKGTVTRILNDALREYFKKHKIKYIERTDANAQHKQK